MTAGRKPKLAEARAREGGTAAGSGAVRHAPKAELVVVAGRNVTVSPPDDLPPEAKELWEEIVRVLADAGIIDAIDLPMLRQLTVQYARSRQAASILDEPVTDEELKAIDDDLKNSEAIGRALQVTIANQLRAGVQPRSGDVNALANYETTIANKRAYRDALARKGRVVALGSTGQLVEHPLVATERNAASLLLRFAGEYAMTPVARTRLGLSILEGRNLQKELEDDLGARTRKVDATAKKPGSGRRPKKKSGS